MTIVFVYNPFARALAQTLLQNEEQRYASVPEFMFDKPFIIELTVPYHNL